MTHAMVTRPIFKRFDPVVQVASGRNARAGKFCRVSGQEHLQLRDKRNNRVRRVAWQMVQVDSACAQIKGQLLIKGDDRRDKAHTVPFSGFFQPELAQGPGRFVFKAPDAFPVSDGQGIWHGGSSLDMVPVRVAVNHQTLFLRIDWQGGQIPGMCQGVPDHVYAFALNQDAAHRKGSGMDFVYDAVGKHGPFIAVFFPQGNTFEDA